MDDMRLQPGATVRVQPGIRHPGLQISLDGWHGRITDMQQVDDGDVYTAVAWDSHTLRAMPPELIRYCCDVQWEWRGWVFTPDQLTPAPPRDSAADAAQTVADIVAKLKPLPGFSEPTRATMQPLLLDAIEWEEEAFDEEEPQFFDVALFLDVLRIADADRQPVHDALAGGLAAYYRQQYGTYRYGKRPYSLIPHKLTSAPIFGHAALAVLAHPTISQESKQTIAYFACQTADPFARDHMPYGLLSFVSFLAEQHALTLELFRGVMLALELANGRPQFVGWSLPYAEQLSAWLLAHPHMPRPEKLWWLWHIGVNLDGQYFAKIGKVIIPAWLREPTLSPATRRELATAWAQQTPGVGVPPPNWRLMQATFTGDLEMAEAIAAEMELEAQLRVDETDILDDLSKTPHIPPIPDHHGPGDDPVGFLQMMMGLRFGAWAPAPDYVCKLATVALAEMGEEGVG